MKSILIIEDNLTDQMIMKRQIKKANIDTELIFVKSIEEGVEIAFNSDINYIFCDFNLPDGTAINFLNRVSELIDTPIVVLSSLTELNQAVEALKIGAFDYIEKQQLSAETFKKIHLNIERHQGELKLRSDLQKRLDENYANTKAILENTQDGIWSLDHDGNLIIINNFAREKLKEQSQQKLKIGSNFFENIIPELKECRLPLFEAALKGEAITQVNNFTFDNREVFIEISASPISDNHEIRGVTFFAREVSERLRGESKLRENERNFRSIFEKSDIPIIVESKKNGEILDLNQAFADLIGLTISELVGKKFIEQVPTDRADELSIILNLYEEGKIDVIDASVLDAKNNTIPVQLSIAEIEFNDEAANLIFVQDISERKEAEQQLQNAKELAEKSAKFKSQFLANMSHEIRTPLNAMMGFTELLSETPLNNDQSEYIQIIQNSSENLLVIINDILDLTKIEAGEMKIKKNPFSLREVVEKCISLHKNNARSKRLELNLEIDPNIPKLLIGSDIRLSQILNNLLSNAIKFTEAGHVSIKVALENVRSQKAYCTFSVEDSGVGMTPDELSIIFESFIQLDQNVNTEKSGTGLGLSIVEQLTKLMDGEIQVNSIKGEGSNFVITLPFDLSEQTSLNENSEESAVSNLNKHHLLVCEDNLVNQKLICKVLDKLDITYDLAENGKEGVDKMETATYTAILMDIQMPVMDGYEATKIIRQNHDTPIIAMSAHVLEEERQQCIELGMNYFVSKPFKISELSQVLSSCLNLKHDQPKTEEKNVISKLNMPTLEGLAEGDTDFIKELFTLYIRNTSQDYSTLKGLTNNEQLLEARRIAHKLNPSLQMFNLTELLKTAEAIESKNTDPQLIDTFINQLQQSLTHIQRLINSLD